MKAVENRKNKMNYIEKSDKINDIYKISKILSEDFTYVRVDLYNIENKIYFGKLTFTPRGCLNIDRFNNVEIKLGKLIDLK